MSNCDSDDEKVIDFHIHRLCQSFRTLTKFMMQKQFLDFSDSLCSDTTRNS